MGDTSEFDFEQLNSLLENALRNYYTMHCACAFPRFIQIVSIDCFDQGKSFQSFETEVLIEKSRKYFSTVHFENKQECHSEKWTCNKCHSEFEYHWSDLSIALNRATLKPVTIHAKTIGLPPSSPIPLYKGLMGYSYPQQTEITVVTFETFEHYILEKKPCLIK